MLSLKDQKQGNDFVYFYLSSMYQSICHLSVHPSILSTISSTGESWQESHFNPACLFYILPKVHLFPIS